jgi:hypothetical protein
MLSNFKEFVKQNESDIILTVSIVLVALVSFGAGLLIDFSEDKKPIIIQQPTSNSINPSDLDTGQTASIQQSLVTEQKGFIGSKNSNKYHWPDCPWAKKISPENQIWFSSEAEAQNAGYIRCGNFGKYTPVDYRP